MLANAGVICSLPKLIEIFIIIIAYFIMGTVSYTKIMFAYAKLHFL